jgi:hypothetical protein
VKISVWYAVSARKTVGYMIFNETINCGREVQVILRQFSAELTEEEMLWHIPATAHTARTCKCMQALSDVFGDRIIGIAVWPAHLPGLNPCDFFFLYYLEGTTSVV